jgi:cytochrome c-type biogenesis protein CcmH/NrfG
MKEASPRTAWRPVLAFCALLALAAIAYSTATIINALRSPEQPRGEIGAPVPPAPAPAGPDGRIVPTDPAPSDGIQAIAAEFEKMRRKEQDRKELIENLRKHARENPDDPGALSKERIDQLEKSGDSLQ